MENGYSLSDIAAVNRDGFGGGNSWVMIILFALIFGGGGFFGNRAGAEPVTEAGLCNSMNFNNLENAVGRISDQQAAIARQTDNGICSLGYETLRNFNALGTQLAESTASINATTTQQTQKILDAICTNRMADMQNQINQLQLQSALCGVVRYPVYATNGNPFANNGGCCGCNGNI